MGKKRRSRRKGGSKRKARKSKERRRKFISKISRDGKISKKEGRKAAKKGISLRKIRNRRISDTRRAQRAFDRTPRGHAPGSKRAGNRPSYNPLKIKRGAEQADRRRQESRRRRSRPEPRRSSRPAPRRAPEPRLNLPPQTEGLPDARTQEPRYEPAYEQPRYDEPMVNYYEEELADIRSDLAEKLTQPDDPRNRRYVLGIRTARRKRNSQGSRGAFGRKAKRMKGLQSTSINL